MKTKLGLFIVIYTCFGNLVAADINAIRGYVENTERFLTSTRAVMDNGALHMTNYQSIAPNFIKAVLEAPEGSQSLDAGAGQGFVLQSLFNYAYWPKFAVNYTVVEKKATNMAKIEQVFLRNKSVLNKAKKKITLGKSSKDIFEFLSNKYEKYDHVFAGFLLNTMSPIKYVNLIELFYQSMKEDALIYITQNSFTLIDKKLDDYPDEYYDRINNADILPFWCMAKPWSKVFYSDPETMRLLLEAFGFEMVDGGLYQNVFMGLIDNIPHIRFTPYVGIIAKKNSSLKNENKITEYKNRAREIEGIWDQKP